MFTMSSRIHLHCLLFVSNFLLDVVADFNRVHAKDDKPAANLLQQRRSIHKSANIGGSRVLECDIVYPSGPYSEHILTWRKHGKEVPIFIQFNGYPPHVDESYLGRIRMLDQSSMELSDIRTRDEGQYECSATFLDGSEENSANGTWNYLTVNSPPVLGDVSPSFLIQKEGETIDIFCEATANPEPILTWQKDQRDLLASDRVSIGDNRIQLKNLQRSDGGAYTCTFKNIVGHVSHTIKLIIEVKGWIISGNAYIMVPPKNVTVLEGSRVKLNCQSEGFPNNITYRWLKNDVDIQMSGGLASRVSIHADGSLVIATSKKDDRGWFKCRPTNGIGIPPEATAYLNITYSPRVLPLPTRLYLPRGVFGRIDCPVDANPPVSHIVWTVNERIIDLEQTPRMKANRQHSLVINSVSKDDEGRYQCTPYSSLGAGQVSSPVQVYVRDPPYFVHRPNPFYQREVTQSVTMPCSVEGDPTPTITWKRTHGPFPPASRARVEDGNLTILHLSTADQGGYECIATNVVTSVIATTLLIIELSLHHPAYNITVETTETTAQISWFPAYSAGQPHHYVLWYRSTVGNRQEWQTISVTANETTSVTIHNLFPDTTYQFMILARTLHGDELFSLAQTIESTKPATDLMESSSSDESKRPQVAGSGPGSGPGRPTSRTKTQSTSALLKPSPPVNLTVTYIATSGLNLTWSAPVYSAVPITNFAIEYKTVGQWVPLTDKLLEYNTTAYTWKTPSRGAIYQFRIFSLDKSKGLLSEPSIIVSINTGSHASSSKLLMTSAGVAGLVSISLAILAAALAAGFAVNFLLKRKRDKSIPYGNVKYFGPNNFSGAQSQTSGTGENNCLSLPPPPPPAGSCLNAISGDRPDNPQVTDSNENRTMATTNDKQLLETLI